MHFMSTLPATTIEGIEMKAPYGQRVAGNLTVAGIVTIAAIFCLAPIADPAGRIIASMLGLGVSCIGLVAYVWILKSVSATNLTERQTWWFGALSQKLHGSVGLPGAAFGALGLLMPVAAALFFVAQNVSGLL